MHPNTVAPNGFQRIGEVVAENPVVQVSATFHSRKQLRASVFLHLGVHVTSQVVAYMRRHHHSAAFA